MPFGSRLSSRYSVMMFELSCLPLLLTFPLPRVFLIRGMVEDFLSVLTGLYCRR